jgi:hypothetical protein
VARRRPPQGGSNGGYEIRVQGLKYSVVEEGGDRACSAFIEAFGKAEYFDGAALSRPGRRLGRLTESRPAPPQKRESR